MGHDISAFLESEMIRVTGTGEATSEIAYLRRSAFNSLAREIYIALQCQRFDAGISGSGESQVFTQDELKAALERLPKLVSLANEHEFLETCISTGEAVRIAFC
jgi:hypothetical protein